MDENNISELVPAVDVTDDREVRSKFWIAPYTRPRSEKKAPLELSKFGIETYVPIQKQLRPLNDRKKVVDVSVILMIVFAQIKEEDIQIIREHSLIVRVISQPGRKVPADIPTEQIDNLKYMLGQSAIPVSFENGYFKSDDFVTPGQFEGIDRSSQRCKRRYDGSLDIFRFIGGKIVKIKSSEIEHKRLSRK